MVRMKVIIGDIHGCYNELIRLLDKISPSSDDEIIALGDIIDRGPDNKKVLDLFSTSYKTIMGNHERKHILISQGHCKPALSQIITQDELGEDYKRFLNFTQKLPHYIELEDAIIVHAAIEPYVKLEEQQQTVLVGSMSGEKHLSENYEQPWYELINMNKPVIFGHKTYSQPFIYKDKVFGIDTGCCMGGELTAITLPDFKIYQVKVKTNQWRKTKRRWKQPRERIDQEYNRIRTLAEKIKQGTNNRKEFAEKIKQNQFANLLFKAYDDKLTKEDLEKIIKI